MGHAIGTRKADVRYLRIAPEMFDTVDVSDAELEAYFDANKTEFRTSERVKTAFVN